MIRGDGLLRPAALVAIAALVVNDHVLKDAYPGFVTGKLSDVAGLWFFPLFVQAVAEVLGLARPGARPVLIAAAIGTAVGFLLTKTWTPANDAYAVGLAALQWPFRAAAAALAGAPIPDVGRVSLVMDATDLVALPAVLGGLVGARAGAPVAAPDGTAGAAPGRPA